MSRPERSGQRQIQLGGSLAGKDCSEAISTGSRPAGNASPPRIRTRRATSAMMPVWVGDTPRTLASAAPVTQVQKTVSTASAASLSICEKPFSNRDRIARRTAVSMRSSVTGSSYSVGHEVVFLPVPGSTCEAMHAIHMGAG